MDNLAKISLGVDVSKDSLDAYIYPLSKKLKVKNSKEGIGYLMKIAKKHKVEVIACESTGGYENLLLNLFHKANFRIWQIDPKRIKAFIYSEGINFKNDPNDAKMIALFAVKKNQGYESLLLSVSKNEKELRELMKLRNALRDDLARYKTKKSNPSTVYTKSEYLDVIKFFQNKIQKLDIKIKEGINKNPALKSRYKILTSIPSVGFITAATLIVEMPELGKLENKQATALLGVAPYTKQSGKYKGKEKIFGGRKRARGALYMAALTAARRNPVLSKFYKDLRERGKEAKVALTAVMRKLGVYSNTMLREGKLWRVTN